MASAPGWHSNLACPTLASGFVRVLHVHSGHALVLPGIWIGRGPLTPGLGLVPGGIGGLVLAEVPKVAVVGPKVAGLDLPILLRHLDWGLALLELVLRSNLNFFPSPSLYL